MVGVGCDIELCIPLAIEFVCQTIDNIQTVGVSVDQGKRGSAQFFERMIADSVFSPNDAEPAPMTVIFVGRDMVTPMGRRLIQLQVNFLPGIWIEFPIES
jgi:hypothetical protein